jgi:hypothetical protein
VLDYFIEREHEFSRFLRRDDAGEGLLNQLSGTKAEQLEDGVVGLENLTLEVGDEERVWGVGDNNLGI